MARDTLRGHTGGDGNLGSGREARPTVTSKGRKTNYSPKRKRKLISEKRKELRNRTSNMRGGPEAALNSAIGARLAGPRSTRRHRYAAGS